jgi:hypothetical protein
MIWRMALESWQFEQKVFNFNTTEQRQGIGPRLQLSEISEGLEPGNYVSLMSLTQIQSSYHPQDLKVATIVTRIDVNFTKDRLIQPSKNLDLCVSPLL